MRALPQVMHHLQRLLGALEGNLIIALLMGQKAQLAQCGCYTPTVTHLTGALEVLLVVGPGPAVVAQAMVYASGKGVRKRLISPIADLPEHA